DDPRYADNALRSENRATLKPAIEAKLEALDGDELCDRLLREMVPAGPVNEIPEVMTAPHTLHRQMRVELDGYAATGIPVKLSRTPGAVRAKPPAYGADGREVLRQAGYTDAEIGGLIDAGVVLERRRTG